jgi:hypothetical protein
MDKDILVILILFANYFLINLKLNFLNIIKIIIKLLIINKKL